MLDVHLPHKKIESLGEFFLHLFTITIGLLIAVGIEAVVERHQHRELASEARETMKEEIRKNDASVADALKSIEVEEGNVRRNLAEIRKIQINPKDPAAQNLNLEVSYNTTGLEDTGWRTAQATGALAFMPYAESEKYSTIYLAEETFLKSEEPLAEDQSRFFGVIQKFNGGKGTTSKEAADALAEQMGILQGHLLNLKIAARVLQEQQSAFLQGREASHHLSERLDQQ